MRTATGGPITVSREVDKCVINARGHYLVREEVVQQELLVASTVSGFKCASQEGSEVSMYHVASHSYSILEPLDNRAHVKSPIVVRHSWELIFAAGEFGGGNAEVIVGAESILHHFSQIGGGSCLSSSGCQLDWIDVGEAVNHCPQLYIWGVQTHVPISMQVTPR